MTRADILATYTVDHHNVIRSPGKFEGEHVSAPYFYEALMNGEADEDEDGVACFELTADDLAQFPELKGAKQVCLSEDDSGFVRTWAE